MHSSQKWGPLLVDSTKSGCLADTADTAMGNGVRGLRSRGGAGGRKRDTTRQGESAHLARRLYMSVVPHLDTCARGRAGMVASGHVRVMGAGRGSRPPTAGRTRLNRGNPGAHPEDVDRGEARALAWARARAEQGSAGRDHRE